MKLRERPIQFQNPRTGEVWICENFENKRKVDGVDFIEVHRPDNGRMVWMNLQNLVKVKQPKMLDKQNHT